MCPKASPTHGLHLRIVTLRAHVTVCTQCVRVRGSLAVEIEGFLFKCLLLNTTSHVWYAGAGIEASPVPPVNSFGQQTMSPRLLMSHGADNTVLPWLDSDPTLPAQEPDSKQVNESPTDPFVGRVQKKMTEAYEIMGTHTLDPMNI